MSHLLVFPRFHADDRAEPGGVFQRSQRTYAVEDSLVRLSSRDTHHGRGQPRD